MWMHIKPKIESFWDCSGNSNGVSGAPCGCPSASPFFAHQSWGPFGTAVVSNGSTSAPSVFANQSLNPFGSGAGPFGQSSSRFTGFGAPTSTTPLFGHPGPTFNIFSGRFVLNALKAKEFYRRDVEYIVRNGGALIINELTGRVEEKRRWSDGIHQAVEAKEGPIVVCLC